MGEPLVALGVQTPTVNGAANFLQGAQARSDLNTQQLAQANASIGLVGQVALGAMGGNINGQVDPTKWAQGQALLKAHGIDISNTPATAAPMLARSSITTLGQIQNAQSQRDFELALSQYGNTLKQQNFQNQMDVGKANYEMHDAPQPNSMFGITTPDALRAQSGLPPAPTFTAPPPTQMPASFGNTSTAGMGMLPAASATTGFAQVQPAAPVAQGALPAVGATPMPSAAPTAPTGTPTSGNLLGLPDVPMTADGRPDHQAQATFMQALQAKSPALADLVQKAANYQLSPSQMFTLRSGNDRAQFDAIMSKYDPTYDANQYAARAAYLKKFTAGAISDNITSASTTIGHLAQLAGNADALHNQNFPAVNSLVNTYKSATGQPEVSNFDVNAKAAGDELAKFFKGTGATDVGSIESWHSSLSHDASPDQIHGAIDTAIGLLKSRLDAMEQQYETTMGHPPPAGYAAFMRPEAQQALVKMGYDPDTLEKADTPDQGNAGAPSSTPAMPKSDADFAALPKGALYIDPDDGKQYRKP